jgi:hypothetical protein
VSHGSRRFDTPIFLIFLVMNAADPVTWNCLRYA